MIKLDIHLQEGEKIEATAYFSKLAAYPWLIVFVAAMVLFIREKSINKFDSTVVGILCFALFAGISLIPFVWATWRISRMELIVTNKRILYKKGIWHVTLGEMAL